MWYEGHNCTDKVLYVVVYFYRPPTKFQEGNAFCRVCVSPKGTDLFIRGPPSSPCPGTSSDLLELVHLETPLVKMLHWHQPLPKPVQFIHLGLGDTLLGPVGKRTVGLRLKGLLVYGKGRWKKYATILGVTTTPGWTLNDVIAGFCTHGTVSLINCFYFWLNRSPVHGTG